MSAKYQNFKTYLSEDHHVAPKEYFVELSELLKARRASLPAVPRVLDVGCATGALLGYLTQQFPDWSYHGVDVSEELVAKARVSVPSVEFSVGSALDPLPGMHGAFDIVLCLGVLGIFSEADARRCLINLIEATASGGVVYVFGQFNDHDVDVQISHRKRSDGHVGAWEAGWSNYSRSTVREWLDGRFRTLRFVEFEMPFAIEPRSDPVRSWTIEQAGKKRLTNGLKLLIDLSFLEVTL